MRRASFPLALLALGALAGGARAQDDGGAGGRASGEERDDLPLRVNDAIARGVARLLEEQREDGRWRGFENEHPGGATALALFTLLHSGVRRGDPAVRGGLGALAGVEWKSTYATAVRLLMLEALREPERHRAEARAGLDFLLATQTEGLWAYPWGAADMSNTQFALLGLRAAHRLGLEVPDECLVDCAKATLRLQARSGGFRYEGVRRPSASVGAATLAGWAVMAEIGAGRRAVERELGRHAADLADGERWLDERWDLTRNRVGDLHWTPGFQYAYLWAVERWGGLTAREELCGHAWYREGAEWLLAQQKADGGWGRGMEDTCFALLFLRRATVTGGGDPPAAAARGDAPRGPARASAGEGAVRVRDWLVCGPWRGRPEDDLLGDPPFDPRRARPKARGKTAREPWEPATLDDVPWVDLEQRFERGGDELVWALATTLVAEERAGGDAEDDAPRPADLWLTVEDSWEVWLDGARVAGDRRVQAPIEETVRVALALEPGAHDLLVLIEDIGGVSAFGARLAAPGGGAPEGVRALDAEERDGRRR